jgi:type II secretory pathway predicted ATPase ExeA
VLKTAQNADQDMRRPSGLMTAAPEAAPPPVDTAVPKNYLDLYGLSRPPFGAESGAVSYILFASHRRSFEPLVDHMINGKGLVLLHGEEGVGKTETLRAAGNAAAESGLPVIRVMRPPNSRVVLADFIAALPNALDASHPIAKLAEAILAPPRKVLLIDDLDLLPPDCVQLLLRLLQPIGEGGSIAVVAASTVDIGSAPPRHEFAELAGLARTTIRLPPIGPAEARQYIERSLWVSGGTTRRLIAPDALKQIIIRSGGSPGAINRQMEAAFTAGFVRGDSRITAKTIAATASPTGRRSKPAPSSRTGPVARIMPGIAIVLLAAGAAMFLYRALSDHHQPPAPASLPAGVQAPSSGAVHPSEKAPGPPAKTSETLPPEVMATLLKRGEQFVALGDLGAARLLFQRAAEAGSARAALAMGRTYDPEYLAIGMAQGEKPDPARAMEWYRKAAALGDAQAADLMKSIVKSPAKTGR